MKKELVYVWTFLCMVLFTLAFSSCNPDKAVEDWGAMKLSKNVVTFPAAGGTDSVKVKNYSGWWISEVRLPNYDYRNPTDSTYHSVSADSFYGKWLTAYVPTNNRKWVVITMKPNTTGEERSVIINMTAGDVFQDITINQSAQ